VEELLACSRYQVPGVVLRARNHLVLAVAVDIGRRPDGRRPHALVGPQELPRRVQRVVAPAIGPHDHDLLAILPLRPEDRPDVGRLVVVAHRVGPQLLALRIQRRDRATVAPGDHRQLRVAGKIHRSDRVHRATGLVVPELLPCAAQGVDFAVRCPGDDLIVPVSVDVGHREGGEGMHRHPAGPASGVVDLQPRTVAPHLQLGDVDRRPGSGCELQTQGPGLRADVCECVRLRRVARRAPVAMGLSVREGHDLPHVLGETVAGSLSGELAKLEQLPLARGRREPGLQHDPADVVLVVEGQVEGDRPVVGPHAAALGGEQVAVTDVVGPVHPRGRGEYVGLQRGRRSGEPHPGVDGLECSGVVAQQIGAELLPVLPQGR